MEKTHKAALLFAAIALVVGCADRDLIGPDAVEPNREITNLEYSIVEGEDGSGILCTFTSDSGGGSADCGTHRLTIPSGAVSGLTDFRIEITSESAIAVKMTATSQGSLVENDVGSAGFLKPLRLIIDYSSATESLNESELKIVWMDGETVLEVTKTTVDTSKKTATGEIHHFSQYVLAQP